MASILTYYNGLTRQGNIALTVETTTMTLAAYANEIATAENLNLNYYIVTLGRDGRFNSVSYPSQTFSQIETALGITLQPGDVFTSTPFQNGLTKELRQIQKLDIAAAKRLADGNPRYTYDINKLPNPYNGNDSAPDDGASTLVVGRPWS